jgi:phage host-nuclease inhibitor protein Gam
LKFATRAKRITNHAVINTVSADTNSFEKYESQIKELQIEINEKNKIIQKYEERDLKEIRENIKVIPNEFFLF